MVGRCSEFQVIVHPYLMRTRTLLKAGDVNSCALEELVVPVPLVTLVLKIVLDLSTEISLNNINGINLNSSVMTVYKYLLFNITCPSEDLLLSFTCH
jgi:hypothetical protein